MTSQLCIVHLVRHSLNYVGWKQRKEVAADLKTIYTAATEAEAEQRLAEFSLKWDAKFPTIATSWRSNWARVIPFFAHPPEIRKVIYTTNAIESLNMSLRKVTKARGSFPNDEAVFKLLYLALRNIAKKWTMSVHDWKAALNCSHLETPFLLIPRDFIFICFPNMLPSLFDPGSAMPRDVIP
jgi:putative transposase